MPHRRRRASRRSRAAGGNERHAGLAGHRSREQRLPCPGADEQDAAWNAAADGGKARRILQELDDLTHLVLRFVNAGNVRKVTGCLGINRSGALQRRHATRHHANEDETRHSEQQETHRDGAVRPALNDCAWRASRRMPRWASR